jgi:hypothetical protein
VETVNTTLTTRSRTGNWVRLASMLGGSFSSMLARGESLVRVAASMPLRRPAESISRHPCRDVEITPRRW